MSAILMKPVEGPSAWRGADLERSQDWYVTLSAEQIGDLRQAVARSVARGGEAVEASAADFDLPSLKPLQAELVKRLKDGHGFAVVRGFPMEGVSEREAQHLFWGFGHGLGTPVTQNGEAELLGHVYDKGMAGGSLNARGFATRAGGGFHVDLSDIVGLMCVRNAMTGGESRLASSMTVHNIILAERPELLPTLYRGFLWDRRNEQGPDESPVSARIPVFSYAGGDLSSRMNKGFINWWSVRSETPLTDAEKEAMDFFLAVAERPDVAITFTLQPGEMVFCNNYTVMHSRTSFEDWPDAARKRYLLRLWLEVPGIRRFEDESVMRYGVIRYGVLGLSPEELARRRGKLH